MSKWSRLASTDEQENCIRVLEDTLEKLRKKIVGGATIGKHPQTVVLDLTYQGSEIYVNNEGILTIRDTTVEPDDIEAVKLLV